MAHTDCCVVMGPWQCLRTTTSGCIESRRIAILGTCVNACMHARCFPYRAPRRSQEDWIGLRRLDEAGKLALEKAPGAHMQFSLDWFESEVMWRYLAGQAPDAA
jgi:hypothetical protein